MTAPETPEEWYDTYLDEFRRPPENAEKLVSYVTNRSGKLLWAEARQAIISKAASAKVYSLRLDTVGQNGASPSQACGPEREAPTQGGASPSRMPQHFDIATARRTGQLHFHNEEGEEPRDGVDDPPAPRPSGRFLNFASTVCPEQVEAVALELPAGPRVCVLGGTAFQQENTEDIVMAVAKRFSDSLSGRVVVLSGGMPGVQEAFSKGLGADFSSLIHLLPEGDASGFTEGCDLACGATLEERMYVFSQLGQVYITFEGGPGVAREAKSAFNRGAIVLPVICTGGASAGMFDFPSNALRRPSFASEAHWARLSEKGDPELIADALLTIISSQLDKASAQVIAQRLPSGPRICILGGTKIQEPSTKALVEAVAQQFVSTLAGKAVVVTGGMPGVQEAFANSLGSFPDLIHLLPEGKSSDFGAGQDVLCGATLEERMSIFGEIGQVYLSFEGGPGVAKEARAAFDRGAFVLPSISTGGASGGLFDFPAAALERPDCVEESLWEMISEKRPPEEAARAIVAIIAGWIGNAAPIVPSPVGVFDVKDSAQAIGERLPAKPRICIIGGTKIQDPSSEALVRAVAEHFAATLAGEVVVLTGGMPGVQETFARSLGGFPDLVHLLPEGESSDFGIGQDVPCGATLDERMSIFGELGQVYLSFEGGPGVAKEARAAFDRGAFVLPSISTGGASGGLFDFPAAALERPDGVGETLWETIREKRPPEEAARAIVAIISSRLGGGTSSARVAEDVPHVIFDGKWKTGLKTHLVTICGSTISSNGLSMAFSATSDKECTADFQGRTCTGMLETRDCLKWSDGRLWRRKGKSDEGFDGTWESEPIEGIVEINGGIVSWQGGLSGSLAMIGPRSCEFRFLGEVCVGSLNSSDDNRLKWNDGDVWRRCMRSAAKAGSSDSVFGSGLGSAMEHSSALVAQVAGTDAMSAVGPPGSGLRRANTAEQAAALIAETVAKQSSGQEEASGNFGPTCTFLGGCLSVMPFGVLGSQLVGGGQLRAGAPEPGENVAVVDPCGEALLRVGPSAARGASAVLYDWLGTRGEAAFPEPVRVGCTEPGAAKLHTYGGNANRTAIHVACPNFCTTPCARDSAVHQLARAYANVLVEFLASGLPTLRLPPLSSGAFAGAFLDELPDLSAEAIRQGWQLLGEEQRSKLLEASVPLQLCILLERDLLDYENAFRKADSQTNGLDASRFAAATGQNAAAEKP